MGMITIGITSGLSIIAKIQSGIYAFFRLLPWVLGAISGFMVLNQITGPVLFMIPLHWLREVFVYVFLALLIRWFFAGIGRSLFPAMEPRRRQFRAGILAVTLLAVLTSVNYLVQWDSDNFDYDAVVGYLPWRPASENVTELLQSDLNEAADVIQNYRKEALQDRKELAP